MNRAEFQQLSRLRLREARALMSGGHYQGAYYLSGYAVECALKACICKQFGRYEFPDRKLVNDSYIMTSRSCWGLRAFGRIWRQKLL